MSDVRLLLDTHVWFWLVNGDPEIKPALRKKLAASSQQHGILVPAICVWELGMLWRKNRIHFSIPVKEWVEEALDKTGFNLIPLTQEIALEAATLPGEFQSDPADCMIVATARIEKATLVTRDSRILAYGKSGHANVLEA